MCSHPFDILLKENEYIKQNIYGEVTNLPKGDVKERLLKYRAGGVVPEVQDNSLNRVEQKLIIFVLYIVFRYFDYL